MLYKLGGWETVPAFTHTRPVQPINGPIKREWWLSIIMFWFSINPPQNSRVKTLYQYLLYRGKHMPFTFQKYYIRLPLCHQMSVIRDKTNISLTFIFV
jgi:hypothetical protein